MLHSVIQAAGRGGRNLGTKWRESVLFYLLFNNSNISENVPGLSQDVREFCLTDSCLKTFLMNYFGSSVPTESIPGWCCSNCDKSAE